MAKKLFLLFVLSFSLVLGLSAQHNHDDHDHSGHDHAGHDHSSDSHDHDAHGDCGHHEGAYDPGETAMHHIADGNVYSILEAIHIPLPTMLYAPDKGWDVFMSNKFHIGHHEDGHSSYNGYVMHHGSVYRVADKGFPQEGSVDIDGTTVKVEDGKDVVYVCYGGSKYQATRRSTLDGGVLGGGITDFYDFSLTKNAVSLILVCLFLFWIFTRAAKAYAARPDEAPSGLQGFLEPLFLFVRDEIAVPFVGADKYKKYFPLLLSIFFFILGLNLFGQVPFFGSVNATGNLTITMVLALLVFIVTNLSGKKDYWKHIFWMPGVPVLVKPVLAVVEIMGLFIKPLTLMLRLAGNISAGHIAILSFIGLIFIFGNSGESLAGSLTGTVAAIPLTFFMMAIELVVAFVQAFVFTMLAASYIGAAVEEHDDHH